MSIGSIMLHSKTHVRVVTATVRLYIQKVVLYNKICLAACLISDAATEKGTLTHTLSYDLPWLKLFRVLVDVVDWNCTNRRLSIRVA